MFHQNFPSLFSDMRHNSPVLSHLSLSMLWANGTQQSANFLHHPSVSWHNSSEIFWLKHYILWTKRSHQCTIFQTFKCSNESSPNSSCHFWNKKGRIYSNFASLFSLIKDSASAIFLAQTLYTLYKSIPSKFQFSNFSLHALKFTKSLILLFK